MICPKCGLEISEERWSKEERLLPYKETQKKFPIAIVVTEISLFRCSCGTSVRFPEIKYYYPKEIQND